MSLLREIQEAAVNPKISTTDLLRMCQVLSYRLGNDAFKRWVVSELDGYAQEETLPDYRSNHRGQVTAQIVNPVRHASKVPVPLSLLPDWYRDRAGRFDFREGVGYLQSLVEDARAAGRSSLQSPVPPEIYASIEIFEGFSTVGMSASMPVSVVAGVLEQVRNRALRFALELEVVSPTAGEGGEEPRPSQDQVTHIYNTTIQGSVGNLAQGSSDFEQVAHLAAGDKAALWKELARLGISGEELAALDVALASDGSAADKPGPATQGWLARVTLRLAGAGRRIGEATTAGLVVAAIARFLGLGSA